MAGANRPGVHLRNVNVGRDFEPDVVADLANARAGAPCPECGGPMRLAHGIEVGNIPSASWTPRNRPRRVCPLHQALRDQLHPQSIQSGHRPFELRTDAQCLAVPRRRRHEVALLLITLCQGY